MGSSPASFASIGSIGGSTANILNAQLSTLNESVFDVKRDAARNNTETTRPRTHP